MTKKQKTVKLLLNAYLTWLCLKYRTSRPILYMYFRKPDNWDKICKLHDNGKVSGFYEPNSSEIHILEYNLDLSIWVWKLRHEWRHHWQYTYYNCSTLWWRQHLDIYTACHQSAVCVIEEDARHFQRYRNTLKHVFSARLLTFFSEDELEKLIFPATIDSQARNIRKYLASLEKQYSPEEETEDDKKTIPQLLAGKKQSKKSQP